MALKQRNIKYTFKEPFELPPCASHQREVWAAAAAKAVFARVRRRPDSYKSAPCFLLLLLRPSGHRFRSSSSARDPRNCPRPLHLFVEQEQFRELKRDQTAIF